MGFFGWAAQSWAVGLKLGAAGVAKFVPLFHVSLVVRKKKPKGAFVTHAPPELQWLEHTNEGRPGYPPSTRRQLTHHMGGLL
jgi:hypothetical protein